MTNPVARARPRPAASSSGRRAGRWGPSPSGSVGKDPSGGGSVGDVLGTNDSFECRLVLSGRIGSAGTGHGGQRGLLERDGDLRVLLETRTVERDRQHLLGDEADH